MVSLEDAALSKEAILEKYPKGSPGYPTHGSDEYPNCGCSGCFASWGEWRAAHETYLELNKPERLNTKIEELKAQLKTVQEELAQANIRLRESRGLLTRMVKYVREDRAVTPRTTRLARLTDQVADYLDRTNDPRDILRAEDEIIFPRRHSEHRWSTGSRTCDNCGRDYDWGLEECIQDLGPHGEDKRREPKERNVK